MSIFKRKIANENKSQDNKDQINQEPAKQQVVCPDFSNTDFNNINPDQMEIFIRQAFELAPIGEKQLIAVTLKANEIYQKLNAHTHINTSYGELNKIFENAIQSGTFTIGTESVKLDMTERGEYTQFLEGISGLKATYNNFKHLFEKNMEA